jgi:hypothetical protein
LLICSLVEKTSEELGIAERILNAPTPMTPKSLQETMFISIHEERILEDKLEVTKN